jgi:hypothetical protein
MEEMLARMDAAKDPYGVIDFLYRSSKGEQEHASEKEYYETLLSTPSFANRVPYLPHVHSCKNGIANTKVMPNTVVRYRGMVQDVYDPEFYCSEYRKQNSSTPEYVNAKYRDELEEDVDELSMEILERDVMLCIPIPGESDWAAAEVTPPDFMHEQGASNPDRKRPAHLTDDYIFSKRRAAGAPAENTHPGTSTGTGERDDTRDETATLSSPALSSSSSTVSLETWLDSLSIDGESCCSLVKIYDNDKGFRLNDLVEIVGIYTIDGGPPPEPEPSIPGGIDHDLAAMSNFGMSDLQQSHYPPSRLAPRYAATLFFFLLCLNSYTHTLIHSYTHTLIHSYTHTLHTLLIPMPPHSLLYAVLSSTADFTL